MAWPRAPRAWQACPGPHTSAGRGGFSRNQTATPGGPSQRRIASASRCRRRRFVCQAHQRPIPRPTLKIAEKQEGLFLRHARRLPPVALLLTKVRPSYARHIFGLFDKYGNITSRCGFCCPFAGDAPASHAPSGRERSVGNASRRGGRPTGSATIDIVLPLRGIGAGRIGEIDAAGTAHPLCRALRRSSGAVQLSKRDLLRGPTGPLWRHPSTFAG